MVLALAFKAQDWDSSSPSFLSFCTHQLVLGRLQWGRGYVVTKLCPFPCSSVCTQLLVSRPDEENITSYLQLIEKCLTHEVRPSLGFPRGKETALPLSEPIVHQGPGSSPSSPVLPSKVSQLLYTPCGKKPPPTCSWCQFLSQVFQVTSQNTSAGSRFLAPCSQGEMTALSLPQLTCKHGPLSSIPILPNSRLSQRHRRSGCCPGSSKC